MPWSLGSFDVNVKIPRVVDVNITVNVVLPGLPAILDMLQFSFSQLEAHMSQISNQLNSKLDALDAAATAAATRSTQVAADLVAQITALTDQLAAGGLSQDEVNAITARIDATQAIVDAIDPNKAATLPA